MQQDYDDDSYYSDDFASHCDRSYSLSSIKSTLPKVKKKFSHDSSTDRVSVASSNHADESKEDDSYSMDDDFAYTSRHRSEYSSAGGGSGNEGKDDQGQQQPQTQTKQYENEKSVDEYSMDEDFASTSGAVSLKDEVALSSSYQYHQEPLVNESKEDDEPLKRYCEEQVDVLSPSGDIPGRSVQAIDEECKHQDSLETNDDSTNVVDHSDSVSASPVVLKPEIVQHNVEDKEELINSGQDVTVPNEELETTPVASDTLVSRQDDGEEYQQDYEDNVATPVESPSASKQVSDPSDDEYIGEVVDSSVSCNHDTTPRSRIPSSLEKKDESNYQHKEGSKQPRQPVCCDAQTQTLAKVKEVSISISKPKTPLKRPSNFVPRCAYARTKTMQLGKEKKAETKPEEPPKVTRRYSKKRLEQLARPARHKVYSKGNIQPESSGNLGGKSKKNKQPSDDSDYGPSFLERMETMGEERQERLVRAAAEALYEARTDKYKCSNCGQCQSYESYVQGQKECQTDRCRSGKKKHLYQPPRQFKLETFEERQHQSLERRNIVVERIQEERRSSIIQASNRKTRHQKELLDKVEKARGDFHSRTQKDIEVRKRKIQNMEKTARALLEKEHSFKPKLNVAEHLIRNRTGGLENLAVPQRRYTQEYTPPPDDEFRMHRHRMQKKKRRRSTRKPLEALWGSKKKIDDDVLRRRFHRGG